MKNINKPLLFIVITIFAGFTSCKKDFLDVNSDPNRATDQNITAELIFTQAENAVGQRAASGDFLFLDHWVGYAAQNGTFAPQQDELTYNLDFSFGDALFQNHYNVLFDLHQAEMKGYANNDTTLSAASIILSAKLFQELVDLYGDIPYSQAFNIATYTHPAYDKAQDIYNSLQLRLDTAIMYMGKTVPKAFGPANIVKAGGVKATPTEWIKFANTLKLRLLIRQSEIGVDFAPVIAKIQSTGGVLMQGESISVNPGYVNDVSKQNPFYAGFGWDPTGVVSTPSNNANDYIINILSSTDDPRLGRFFYPVGFNTGTYAGAVFGAPLSTVPLASSLSYFGPGLVGGITSTNVGDGTGAIQDQFIYPSYESMFLYAEAVARNWIPGDANQAYLNALTESFAWLGAPTDSATVNDYISANPDIADFSTVASGTPLAKAQFLAYQKYIANTLIDPLESYSDIRRLDFLTDDSYISQAPGKLSDKLPLRLLYPQSEYTTNGDNVKKEGTINIFTTPIFWDKP